MTPRTIMRVSAARAGELAKLALLFACMLPGGSGSLSAAPAVLDLHNGRRLNGELTVVEGGFRIAATNGLQTKVALAAVRRGRFNLPGSVVLVEPSTADGPLSAIWKSADLGATGAAGEARVAAGAFLLRGAGNALGAKNDCLFLVSQPLRGNAQITARLVSFDSSSGITGLMLRESSKSEAAFAAMFARPPQKAGYRFCQTRSQSGNPRPETQERANVKIPCWIRLRRQGNQIQGFFSWDAGVRWEKVFGSSLDLPSEIVAGLFVISGSQGMIREARFDHVSVEGVDESGISEGRPRHSVVLCDGSVIRGELRSADPARLTMLWQGQPVAIPTVNIARVLFDELPNPSGPNPRYGSAGVLLARDDFLQAEFKGFQSGNLKVDSVLFGRRSFRAGDQVKALCLREVKAVPPQCEVKTGDGSVWHGSSARLDQEALMLDVPLFGAIRLPWAKVLEIQFNPGKG